MGQEMRTPGTPCRHRNTAGGIRHTRPCLFGQAAAAALTLVV